MSKTIHIVCLDAPSPPDYGGAIDMYFKVKALALAGNKVILHYFDYKENRGAGALKDICIEVNSYHRKSFLQSISLQLPYIVSSRINLKLIERLNRDDHPIIVEGIHCTGILPYLKDRSRVLIRMHNEEESYYNSLFQNAGSLSRKMYFFLESKLIKSYQQTLSRDIKIASLSEADIEKFRQAGFQNLHFIPCFIPWRHTTSLPGKGSYCLYHGNMAIAENESSALWLIENVFNKTDMPLIVAGNMISHGLVTKSKPFSNVSFINNPGMDTLEGLIKDAQVNVLPSMNNTGVKLKLLHALFGGRHCITNTEGIKGTGITKGVHIANTADEFRTMTEMLMKQNFQHADIEERREISRIYNNLDNAGKLSELL